MTTDSKKSITRFIPAVVRILMGLCFFVFGLNGFFHFIPQPDKPIAAPALAFIAALMGSGYMFPLIAGTQVLSGALLLVNRFVPLALALLAPMVVNILAFHVFLEHSGTGVAIVVLLLEVYLAWAYRKAFYPMLAARVTPN